MKKIYVTITKKGFLPLLKNRLENYDIEALNIDENTEPLTGFYALITSNEHVNTDWLKSLTDYHLILLLDPTKEISVENINNVVVFEDEDGLIDYIVAAPLANPTLSSFTSKKAVSNSSNVKDKSSNQLPAPNFLEPKQEPNAETLKQKTIATKEVPTNIPLSNKESKLNKEKETVVAPREDDEVNNSKPIILEDYPDKDRVEVEHKRIQGNLAYRKKMRRERTPGSKVIGVWSPEHKMGVTTFVINFAIYIKKNLTNKLLSVLEIPNSRPRLLSMLTRYQSKPEEWISFIKAHAENEQDSSKVYWGYKGVTWLPLGHDDDKYWKNEEQIDDYFFKTLESHIVFADFPTGEMKKSALHSLSYLDELWILVDDSFHNHKEWKTYIDSLIATYNVPVHLIFGRHVTGSDIEKVEKEMGLGECIAILPSLFEEVQANNYETLPIIETTDIRKLLKPDYDTLINHLNLKVPKSNSWDKFKKLLFPRLIPDK